ncbi:MAG: hypothetical protein V4526_01190 [Patescibacteria group bacterium]
MDILSHGLWGAIIWGRKNRKLFWLSFVFGIAPDLFSFGIFTAQRLFQSLVTGTWEWQAGPPELSSIPQYVDTLYDITHSFVVFLVAFLIVWAIRGKIRGPLWAMMAWPFHIFLDLFTHSTKFFPTPYLWPLPFAEVNGIPWSTPIIFFTNVICLVVIYAVYFYRKRKFKRGEIDKI